MTPEERVSFEEELQALPSDAARARLCAAKASAARAMVAQGRTEAVARVLRSESGQFRGLDAASRQVIGRTRWMASGKARELIEEDQFFSRLAMLYAALAQMPPP